MKRFLFYQFARGRILDLLRKYIQGTVPDYTKTPPSGGLGNKETAIFSYWIPDCHIAMSRHHFQPKTTKSQWMHVASDPARIRSAIYKRLPRVQ